MTTYAWPTERWALPQAMELRVVDNLQRWSESPLSGYVQTLAMPGARWGWAMDFAGQRVEDRAKLEAYLMRLQGMQHRVSLYDLKNPRPAGTINLSGVTTSGTAAQFATSVNLQGCGANTTLKAGDWFGIPSGQLLRCTADFTANGSGVMTGVTFTPMLRAALSSGAAITLDKPTALYVRTEPGLSVPRTPGRVALPMSVEFMEVFA